MAISAAVQTLSAAFSFGILLQAATGALLIFFKGHGSTLCKDGRRLVLVLFLLFAALWAQISFLNLMIIATHPTICQTTVIFTTAFDQLARFGVEQFLLWLVGQGSKANAGRFILQAILGIRLIAGSVLVGFTRRDFAPVCIARTSVEPVAIVVIALDFVIIGFLLVRAVTLGMFRDMKDSRSSTRDQSKGLILTIAGFAVWTGTSVPMMLGVSTIILIVRTVVPANGLLILVGILTFSSRSLLEVREEIITPEARSPFVAPPLQTREIFREEVGNGSPIAGHNYTRSGSLFVVNPSSTPRDSPTAPQGYFQGSTSGLSKLGAETTVRDLGAEEPAPRNIPGYRGSSGVFPTMIASSMSYDQGAIAPTIRPSVNDNMRNVPMPSVPPPTAQQKRSLFNRSKQPAKPNIRSLGISKPVMNEDENTSQQPFARIQTIDLAQAAVNERERREAAVERSRLIASRPAPPPPHQFRFPAQEGLRKSVSVKRKQMASRTQETMPTIASSSSSGLSVDAANGSTTSASLSPGREEVRRRSPRNANAFEIFIDEKARPLPTRQRKQTIGLPSNPRATRIAPMTKEQTVMFMNDIVYDNPGVVKTIIKEAPEMYALVQIAKAAEKSPTASYTTDLKSSGSIMHRPRPYRRKSETERGLFQSEPSPRHKRSKSGSSVSTRKSLLMSHPGSPTQLPPLPPPPKSAARLKRLLPNNTKSMTVDEKIQLLFPAPPGVTTLHNRRSSVPSLPRVPSFFMSGTPLTQSPTQEEQQSRGASNRTTIASFGLPDVTVQTPEEEDIRAQERETYRFSASTYRTLADQVGETWIPGIPVKLVNMGGLGSNVTDMDSHVLQNTWQSHMTETSSSNMSTDDDSTTYWGSVHSEIPPVDLSTVMRNANSTFIQRSRAGTLEEVRPPAVASEAEESRHGEEIMTVMLECEQGSRSTLTSDDNRQSFFLDADQSLPGDKTPTSRSGKTWHRRIGDELPTFSERKARTRSRKMAPPTPLLLNQRGRVATVVVRAAESSPQVSDSPERAIAEIQAQLRRFEEPGRGSVGSLLRHIPEVASDGVDEVHNDRFRLLENLENEMGQQENQWQQMQTNLDRDSMTSIMTPAAPAQSESEVSRESSQRSSRPPSRVVSRRARIRSSMTIRSKGDDSTLSTSTQSSDNSRASVWQQRLAEAQMEYMENAPALLRKRSLNFLSVSKSHQLGSPTPPDSVDSGTDTETDSEMESESEEAPAIGTKEPLCLWEAQLPSPKAATGRMWNPPYKTSERAASPEPPAKNARPAQRQIQFPLRISSSDLWSISASAPHSRPVTGLWGSKLVRPVSIRTRPVTQRPARKSKRVTFLPDIVESPVPLPNKRDTLGIFQFPWGETSDSAVYQPAFNPALLSGPILDAKLDARSRQLEPESEYSSSFFDDYDEDVEEDDAESDDDFDETTLWEIASLLKSEDVPSKNSLLPRPREVIEDYDVDEETEFEEDSEAEEEYQSNKSGQLMTKLPIMPLAMSAKGELEVEFRTEPMLWASDMASTLAALNAGLPQPEPSVWEAYFPSPEDIICSKPHSSETLPALISRDLWTISESEATSLSGSPMWSGSSAPMAMSKDITSAPKAESSFMWKPRQEQVEIKTTGLFSVNEQRSEFRSTKASPAVSSMKRTPRPSNAALPALVSQNLWAPGQHVHNAMVWTSKSTSAEIKAPAQAMWAPAAETLSVAVVGLFSLSHARSNFRTTTQLPTVMNMTCKPRASNSALAQITSTHLWRMPSSLTYEHHWISESSIRPSSPSVYSEASSGRSSPASETSSISGASLMSTSTKASSVWGSIKSASITTWWDSKGARKTPSPPPTGENPVNAKFASKLPVAKGLAPVRESRVLASRDMWEAKAPVALGEIPKRNFKVMKKEVDVAKEEAEGIEVVKRPLRRQFTRTVVSNADWDEALAEAIAAGILERTLWRPAATVADWESALDDAISKGTPRLQRLRATAAMWQAALEVAVVKGTIPTVASALQYDPAVLHPVFFASSMVSNIIDIHPAAIGHVLRPQAPSINAVTVEASSVKVQCYDPAVFHPVFFTTSLVSSISDIHPVAVGHVIRPEAPSMWIAPYMYAAALDAPIGSMWKKGKIAAAQFEHDKTETKRNIPAARSMKLPTLESGTTWQPARSIAITERNWIVAPKLTRAQTWAAPVAVDAEEIKGMWTPKSAAQIASPDMFAHIVSSPITKSSSRATTLSALNSRELFVPASVSSKESTHWLNTTSTTCPVLNAGMWLAPKKTTVSKKDEPDMFSHINGEHIKKAKSARPAPLSRLNSTELFELAPKTEVLTHWLHSTSSSTTSTLAPSTPIRVSASIVATPTSVPTTGSQTWTAPSTSVQEQESSSMWTLSVTIKVDEDEAIFSNPHGEPWTKSKRSDSGVELSADALESREMWSRKYFMPESPKEWLLRSEKRVSKVQFRY